MRVCLSEFEMGIFRILGNLHRDTRKQPRKHIIYVHTLVSQNGRQNTQMHSIIRHRDALARRFFLCFRFCFDRCLLCAILLKDSRARFSLCH